MRFQSPPRESVDPRAFSHPVFAEFAGWHEWCVSAEWPSLTELNAAWPQPCAANAAARWTFVAQTPGLLADGLHYESRIAGHGAIATREANWHDLFNALIWLRHPALKRAMNQRQAADVAAVGPKQRTRGQCALTQFDEAGVLLLLRDGSRVRAWDRHDWCGLFTGLQADEFALAMIGHALLEHALEPSRLLVGKALVVVAEQPRCGLPTALDQVAHAIASGELLLDPTELRPLPLMGLPDWHQRSGDPAFLREAPCFQPIREGRRYPPALSLKNPG